MSNADPLFNQSPAALLATVSGSEIALWSETKKTEFVGTFKDRVRVARYLLLTTAAYITDTALERKFISNKHIRKHDLRTSMNSWDWCDKDAHGHRVYDCRTIAGRSTDELDNIAKERSKTILDELPSIQAAVKIIDPDTAKLIERKEILLEKGGQLMEQLQDISEPIAMSEVDQTMSVGDFLKSVKERDKKRRRLQDDLNEIGEEGSRIEETICKKLYAGLPGLSDAVVAVILSHKERAVALDATSRRVEEQVKFGDNDAALELLRHFEKDETRVSDEIQSQFTAAIEQLKLSVKGVKVKSRTKRVKAGA